MGWWSGEGARFQSPLSPDECTDRLRRRVVSLWKPFGGGDFAGTIGRSRVAITPRRIARRNSWQTWYVGRIEPSGSGSLIVGHFRVAQPVKVFMAFWFGGVTLFAFAFIGTSIARQSVPWMAVAPLGMLGFGICLVWLGMWMARDDRSVISAMLAETLIARETS